MAEGFCRCDWLEEVCDWIEVMLAVEVGVDGVAFDEENGFRGTGWADVAAGVLGLGELNGFSGEDCAAESGCNRTGWEGVVNEAVGAFGFGELNGLRVEDCDDERGTRDGGCEGGIDDPDAGVAGASAGAGVGVAGETTIVTLLVRSCAIAEESEEGVAFCKFFNRIYSWNDNFFFS